MKVRVTQLCLILCDPMDCSLLGSSVHGILQARILEWVAIPFSRGSSQPRSLALQADSLPSESPAENSPVYVVQLFSCKHQHTLNTYVLGIQDGSYVIL